MTRYVIFEQLQEIMKLTKTERGYSKFIQTGKLELGDYDRGFIDLDIYSLPNYKNEKEYYVRIWFGTVDDGDLGGWLLMPSKTLADQLVEKIANEVFKDMISFPTIKELNNILKKYNISIKHE